MGAVKEPKIDLTKLTDKKVDKPITMSDLGLSGRLQSEEIAGQKPAVSGPDSSQGQAIELAGQRGSQANLVKPAPAAAAAPARAPALSPNAVRWVEIQRLLNLSTLGKKSIQHKSSYSVGINWVSGTGSFYDAPSNSMTLDTTETHAESALTFAHEMNHAHYHHANLGANVMTLTRAAYVNASVAEEVEGTIISIEAKGEMNVTQAAAAATARAQRKPVPASAAPITATFPLEVEYKAAYQAAIRAGKAQAEARTAARARVRKGFDDGEVTTSNTSQTYAQYYGTEWDAAHAPRPASR